MSKFKVETPDFSPLVDGYACRNLSEDTLNDGVIDKASANAMCRELWIREVEPLLIEKAELKERIRIEMNFVNGGDSDFDIAYKQGLQTALNMIRG